MFCLSLNILSNKESSFYFILIFLQNLFYTNKQLDEKFQRKAGKIIINIEIGEKINTGGRFSCVIEYNDHFRFSNQFHRNDKACLI